MLSRDNGKLCFEMLEINSASQNHLPCGSWKTPPKSAFCPNWDLKCYSDSLFFFSLRCFL